VVCPNCSATNDDNAWKCVQCQTVLQQAPPPSGPPLVIPNYLWQAIVCTACCCVPLGIPAIVYAAQVNTKVVHGDLEGARRSSKNAKMWCWIAFGTGLAWILTYFAIVFAITIPNLFRSRIAANQAAAIGSLRTLNTVTMTYSATFAKGFPPTLMALGPPAGNGAPDAESAGLIDKMLASGMKSNYVFTYSPGERDSNGVAKTYTIYADPILGSNDQYHYFTDQTGIIRQEKGMPANAKSPPLE